MTRSDAFRAFAGVFAYPDAGFPLALENARRLAAEDELPPDASRRLLLEFVGALCPMAAGDAEELYTRTFDINPVASLEVGWHLYGEQYERGAFLVRMRGLLRALHIAESAELPDHLSHVLQAVGSMEEAEAEAFTRQYLSPALEKIAAGFAEPGNPYGSAVRSLQAYLGVPSADGGETRE